MRSRRESYHPLQWLSTGAARPGLTDVWSRPTIHTALHLRLKGFDRVNIRDKIMGGVMGLFVGGALGAPLQNAKSGAIRSTFGTVDGYVDAAPMLGNKLHRRRTPGLYGVNGQLALALLDTCLERRGLDPVRAGELLADLSRGDAHFPFGALRGAGADVRNAALNHKQRQDWTRAGHPHPGGAPAARIAPVALYYAQKPHALPEKIIEASFLTNRDITAASAAAAVAALILELLKCDHLNQRQAGDILHIAADYARDVELRIMDRYADSLEPATAEKPHLFSTAVSELSDRLGQDPDQVEKWIVTNANSHASMDIKRPTVDFALSSVIYSIYVFTKYNTDFQKTLIVTINQGGDADTTGSICGALCGVLHGESAIPAQWLKGLANNKQLSVRAAALADNKFPRSAILDLYEMEYDLTRKEFEEREAVIRKSRRFAQAMEKKKAGKSEKKKSPSKQKIDRKKLKKLKEKREWHKLMPPD